MLILQCILGLQSQSIDFTNAIAQADIPSGEPVFIELISSQHKLSNRKNSGAREKVSDVNKSLCKNILLMS